MFQRWELHTFIQHAGLQTVESSSDLFRQKGLCQRPAGTQRRDRSWNLAHEGLREKISVTGEKTWLWKWAA